MSLFRAAKLIALLALVAMVSTGCRGCLQNGPLGRYFGGGSTVDPLGPGAGIESSVLPEPIRGSTPQEIPDLKRVYFAFDSAGILEPAKGPLNQNADWLMANPAVQIQIEGHCDERGTADYNYALGEQRANAVREYLIGQGVEPGRIHTISYGSDRPANPASNERAWAENRRAQFMIYGM